MDNRGKDRKIEQNKSKNTINYRSIEVRANTYDSRGVDTKNKK